MNLPSRAVSSVFATVQNVAGKLTGIKDIIREEAVGEGNEALSRKRRGSATPVFVDDEAALQKLTKIVMASLESQECLQRAICQLGTYAKTFTTSNKLVT